MKEYGAPHHHHRAHKFSVQLGALADFIERHFCAWKVRACGIISNKLLTCEFKKKCYQSWWKMLREEGIGKAIKLAQCNIMNYNQLFYCSAQFWIILVPFFWSILMMLDS